MTIKEMVKLNLAVSIFVEYFIEKNTCEGRENTNMNIV